MQNSWLWLCFFVSCYFYGTQLNPLLLISGIAGPLAVIAATPAARLAALSRHAPVLFWGSLAAAVLIVLHQLFLSTSPGTSFFPSLILACLPLWAVTVALLKYPRRFWVGVSVVVAAFAASSAAEFVWIKQRAHAPFLDPANYLTLLYLVAIPWVVLGLKRGFTGWRLVLLALAVAVFGLAMLATHLRFAMLVCALLLLLVLWAVVRFGCRWQTALAVTGAALLGAALYLGVDPSGAASSVSGTSAVSAQASPRMLIWQAAWEGVRNLGGVSGTGLGTFIQIYPMFRSPAEQSTAGFVVHNDFLQLLLEGGIVLFVPLLLVCVWVGLSAAHSLLVRRELRREAGVLLALSVAVIHAAVNFVFYVLPLVIVFATLLALVYGRGLQPTGTDALLDGRRPWQLGKALAVAVLTLNLGYVLLDIMNLGVFAGYNQAPGADHIRADEDRVLQFARLSQRLNASRGMPVFGEARILEQRLRRQPTPLLVNQTDAAYRSAAERDPWNVAVLGNYAAFKQSLQQYDAQRALLAQVLTRKPYDTYANAALLQWHLQRGNAEATSIARNVFTWCGIIANAPQARALFEQAGAVLTAAGDDAAIPGVERCMAELERPRAHGRRQTAFMRWMAGKPAAGAAGQ